MRKLVTICLGLIVAITACDTQPDLNNCDFDESAMLTNYADDIIIPRFGNLETGVILLDGVIAGFASDPTLGMLTEVRVTFGAAYVAYQRCSSFGFGPGLIAGIPYRDRFNTFPTNTTAIEQNIANATAVSASPKSAVGFPAIEYLIFGNGTQSDQEVFDLFTTDANAANRLAYLQQLSAELRATTQQINQGWQNYRSSFVSNLGTAEGSSISLLVNEFNYDFEVLKNFKFKIPLGKLNGGVILPQNVEGFYAGGSALLATEQTSASLDMFLGVGENLADGQGLYEYLVCLDAKTGDKLLADDIKERFDLIIEKLEAIPDPMAETLASNKPIVDAAYTEMQMMVPKIKHDMTSALGVQISYQDADGD